MRVPMTRRAFFGCSLTASRSERGISMRLRAGVAACAAVVVLAITGAASAHVVYETGNVYQDPANGRCVKVYAELSDGGYQHGYIRTTVWTMKRGWTPYGE